MGSHQEAAKFIDFAEHLGMSSSCCSHRAVISVVKCIDLCQQPQNVFCVC